MPYQIMIKVVEGSDIVWKQLRPSCGCNSVDGSPYLYRTRQEAVDAAMMLYPDNIAFDGWADVKIEEVSDAS